MAQRTVEILKLGVEAVTGQHLLTHAALAAHELGFTVNETAWFKGGSEWLCVFGAGAADRDNARKKQIASGGHVACWDFGYIKSSKFPGPGYARVSIDQNHPWRYMDRTSNDPARLKLLEVVLREDATPEGPVIVIGMGPKSRAHLGINEWEDQTLRTAQKRFPNRRVLYRPKPLTKNGKLVNRDKHIKWETTGLQLIGDVLKGASLVICRHSNVAIDACIAGVPVECEDGVAYWLYKDNPNPTVEQREDFLCRAAHWQYRLDEQKEAWKFLMAVGA